eukprot:3359476-Prymnesium_polylepis.1
MWKQVVFADAPVRPARCLAAMRERVAEQADERLDGHTQQDFAGACIAMLVKGKDGRREAGGPVRDRDKTHVGDRPEPFVDEAFRSRRAHHSAALGPREARRLQGGDALPPRDLPRRGHIVHRSRTR